MNPQDLWLPKNFDLHTHAPRNVHRQPPSKGIATQFIENHLAGRTKQSLSDNPESSLSNTGEDSSIVSPSSLDPSFSPAIPDTATPTTSNGSSFLTNLPVTDLRNNIPKLITVPLGQFSDDQRLESPSTGKHQNSSSPSLSGLSASTPSSALEESKRSSELRLINCEFLGCNRSFSHRHVYKYVLPPPLPVLLSNPTFSKHKKSHEHPKHCPHCDRGFETQKDVRRHMNDKHEKTKRYYCSISGCKYARAAEFGEGKERGFARKENWRRHMRNQHGMNDASP